MDRKESDILNNLAEMPTQTPMEIALGVDENGMTTASNLYAFLELEPKNFSHGFLDSVYTR